MTFNTSFDPEGTFTKDSSIFGMPIDENAGVHLIPSPWEPTTSFKKGTVLGPKALYEASKQMDLFHPYFKKIYEKGVFWKDNNYEDILNLDKTTKAFCERIRQALEESKKPNVADLKAVNEASDQFNTIIYKDALDVLGQGKIPGLVGGDHSSPFGLIKALSEKHKEGFSIVHIDAHFDFRKAYQGFEHSHASIMYNVREKLKNPPKIFQLGIRDFSKSEFDYAQKNSIFLLDQEFQRKKSEGLSYYAILEELFKDLDEMVYMSFDIDGLSPEFCPGTGTPVPGGISFSEASQLIHYLHRKGHELIGFDLVETSPNPKLAALGEGLDEVTGIRLLYDLSCFGLSSQ